MSVRFVEWTEWYVRRAQWNNWWGYPIEPILKVFSSCNRTLSWTSDGYLEIIFQNPQEIMLAFELGEAALDKFDFYDWATSLRSCCLYYEDRAPQPQFIEAGGKGTSYSSEEPLLCTGVAQLVTGQCWHTKNYDRTVNEAGIDFSRFAT